MRSGGGDGVVGRGVQRWAPPSPAAAAVVSKASEALHAQLQPQLQAAHAVPDLLGAALPQDAHVLPELRPGAAARRDPEVNVTNWISSCTVVLHGLPWCTAAL